MASGMFASATGVMTVTGSSVVSACCSCGCYWVLFEVTECTSWTGVTLSVSPVSGPAGASGRSAVVSTWDSLIMSTPGSFVVVVLSSAALRSSSVGGSASSVSAVRSSGCIGRIWVGSSKALVSVSVISVSGVTSAGAGPARCVVGGLTRW